MPCSVWCQSRMQFCAARMSLELIEMEEVVVTTRPRWKDRRYAKGLNWRWRPTGGASGIYIDRADWFDMKQWVEAAVIAVTALIEGKPYTAPDDLTVGADRMHPEARALAPWATWGKYEAAPVPIAVLIESGEFAASASGKMKGFYESMLAADSDTDIISDRRPRPPSLTGRPSSKDR